jgi:hypothetical protein
MSAGQQERRNSTWVVGNQKSIRISMLYCKSVLNVTLKMDSMHI